MRHSSIDRVWGKELTLSDYSHSIWMSSAVVNMRELRLYAVGAVIFQTWKASNTETSLWKWRRGHFSAFWGQWRRKNDWLLYPTQYPHMHPFLAVCVDVSIPLLTSTIAICYIYYNILL